MFKILILQRLYNLSDQQIEFQVNDRLSFGRFLRLPLGGAAPDYTTVWKFREVLVRAEAVKALFDLFTRTLSQKGLITKEGTIADASFVEVPRQRKMKEDNELGKIWKDSRGLERAARETEAEGSGRSMDQEKRRILLWIQRSREVRCGLDADHRLRSHFGQRPRFPSPLRSCRRKLQGRISVRRQRLRRRRVRREARRSRGRKLHTRERLQESPLERHSKGDEQGEVLDTL
jgi:IS5 family transposase